MQHEKSDPFVDLEDQRSQYPGGEGRRPESYVELAWHCFVLAVCFICALPLISCVLVVGALAAILFVLKQVLVMVLRAIRFCTGIDISPYVAMAEDQRS